MEDTIENRRRQFRLRDILYVRDPPIPKITNAERCREYRLRLKMQHPEKHQAMSEQSRERSAQSRRKPLTEEELMERRKKERIRGTRYREAKRKQSGGGSKPFTTSSQKTPVPKTRMELKQQRTEWRERKRAQRAAWCPQEHKRHNEKCLKRYYDRKASTTPVPSKHVQLPLKPEPAVVDPGTPPHVPSLLASDFFFLPVPSIFETEMEEDRKPFPIGLFINKAFLHTQALESLETCTEIKQEDDQSSDDCLQNSTCVKTDEISSQNTPVPNAERCREYRLRLKMQHPEKHKAMSEQSRERSAQRRRKPLTEEELMERRKKEKMRAKRYREAKRKQSGGGSKPFATSSQKTPVPKSRMEVEQQRTAWRESKRAQRATWCPQDHRRHNEKCLKRYYDRKENASASTTPVPSKPEP